LRETVHSELAERELEVRSGALIGSTDCVSGDSAAILNGEFLRQIEKVSQDLLGPNLRRGIVMLRIR
jgi:hypothetical protein